MASVMASLALRALVRPVALVPVRPVALVPVRPVALAPVRPVRPVAKAA